MENSYYSCYRYYSSKHRRLSAFAQQINDDEIEVFIWECDRKDVYMKKIARHLYETYLECKECIYKIGKNDEKIAKPLIFTVALGGKQPKRAFLDYLQDNYYRAIPIYKISRYLYVKADVLNQLNQII